MPPPETQNPPPVAAGEGQKASDFPKRLNRYSNAKSHTASVLAALGKAKAKALGLPYKRITECGDWLKFRDYYTIGQIKLAGASFCKKHLVCSLCAIRRASRLMASYLERFQVVRKSRPDLCPVFVTLTVRNSHNLEQVLEHLLACLRLLHRRRSRQNQPSVMHSVEGGVYSIELTHDAATGWHPHVHAIWLVSHHHSAVTDPTAWALRELSPEWHRITGDSFIVHARPVDADGNLPDDIDPHAGGFAEVFKYALKPSELGVDRLIEAYPHLAGKRLIGSFGLFRGVPEPENLADDLTDFDGLPYEEFLVSFLAGKYRRIENVNA